MKESQRKYLEEYEKYKHIKIEVGPYHVKDRTYLVYDIISIDEDGIALAIVSLIVAGKK